MANHSGSAGSMPADEPVSNWEWMRERLALSQSEQSNRERFEQWLSAQLKGLEADYEQCETHDSRMRDLRQDFSQSR